MEYTLDIITDQEIPFRVVYGRRTYMGNVVSSFPVVAFYDRRYQHDTHGQFVGDYTSETVLNGDFGLNLNGGEPEWTVDRHAMRLVRAWVRDILARS